MYEPIKIEKKWQDKWNVLDLYKSEDFDKKPKKYILAEFPYPSGDGLHVGHCRSYTALDIIARKSRMNGFNTLYPMGWDAFGLPTENYAIKTGRQPKEVTKENTDNFRRQMKALAFSFDWSREINTTDPSYYKWTQWIFLQFYKAGLAYKQKAPINWCPSCKIGLANEEVIDGKCERCSSEVIKKDMEQWMLRITAYADRLIKGLDDVDYPERVKAQQKNWIGRSEGVEVDFYGMKENEEYCIPIFTTRIDTIYGVSAVVLAPEHPLVMKLVSDNHKKEVEEYIEKTAKKTDLERKESQTEKTGVPLDAWVINPFTKEKVSVWISDYVMLGYGTGAVMVVPAHDERDFAFATKFDLNIKEVIAPGELDKGIKTLTSAYTDEGIVINSEEFNGLTSKDARVKMADNAESKNFGRRQVNYHLRDWLFSRQHYWGEPIPIIYCDKCGELPVPEIDLPIELPQVDSYEPTDTGESPLAIIDEWVNIKCFKCGGRARRETDTMPNWAGSSWYFLRYMDPNNNKVFADKKNIEYWMPVDIYNGGMEHTTLHLLYSRFWNLFLFDQGLVPFSEPYKKRTSHGMVLAGDGQKMSKSRGNVVNPDEVIKEYGADTLRLYEMFMGPFSDAISWDAKSIVGVYRFLDKVWTLKEKIKDIEDSKLLHKTIKGVTEDIENFKFNTAVSKMMIFVNESTKTGLNKKDFQIFLLLLSPFAPHITEELWEQLGNTELITKQSWPIYDKNLIQDDEFELVFQVNGKVRDRVVVNTSIDEEEAKRLALESENVKKHLDNREPKKIIFTGKLVNIVV